MDTKLKYGDRVKALSTGGFVGAVEPGMLGTVVAFDRRGVEVDFDGASVSGLYMYFREVEKAPGIGHNGGPPLDDDVAVAELCTRCGSAYAEGCPHKSPYCPHPHAADADLHLPPDYGRVLSPAEVRAGHPDTNPKTKYGRAKPSMSCVPTTALIHLMRVMDLGRAKYGLMNWRNDAVSFSTYFDAAMRHMMSAQDGEWLDPESGAPHMAHAMACMAIVLDAQAVGKLNDDRPTPGVFAELVKAYTIKLEGA